MERANRINGFKRLQRGRKEMIDTRTNEEKIKSARNKSFSMEEAVEFEKHLDRYVTSVTTNWVSLKTGNKISIGYNK